jgi:hypothetical protein
MPRAFCASAERRSADRSARGRAGRVDVTARWSYLQEPSAHRSVTEPAVGGTHARVLRGWHLVEDAARSLSPDRRAGAHRPERLPGSCLSCCTACSRSPCTSSAFQSTWSRVLDTTYFFAVSIVRAKGITYSAIHSGQIPVARWRHAASIISYVTRPKSWASARSSSSAK